MIEKLPRSDWSAFLELPVTRGGLDLLRQMEIEWANDNIPHRDELEAECALLTGGYQAFFQAYEYMMMNFEDFDYEAYKF